MSAQGVSHGSVLDLLDSVPELITLAACDPMNDKLTGCNKRVREARATVAELIATLELVRDNAMDDSPAMWDRVDAALARAGGAK